MPGRSATGNRRNSSTIGGLMTMPPKKFSATQSATTKVSNDFVGTSKVIGKPNANPMLRKKAGSVPLNNEHIFAGPTSPEIKESRVKSVASRMHSDPFDAARQKVVSDSNKKKLTPSHAERPERRTVKHVNPADVITVHKGIVAGSGLVFNGGKRHAWPEHRERSDKADAFDSRKHKRHIHDRKMSALADGKGVIGHTIVNVEKPAIKSPTRHEVPDWHDQSNVAASHKSAMLGGVCLPTKPRVRTETKVHPPWHTSTPRVAKSASKAGYQPPWHTTTPRDAARAKLARFGRRTLNEPRANTPRQAGKKQTPVTSRTVLEEAPFARESTAAFASKGASELFNREATAPISAQA